MKQIEVTNYAAAFIEDLRATDMESLHLAKISVADGMSLLARLLQIGRDDQDIAAVADGLLAVMNTLSEYNSIIDMLVNEADTGGPAKYCLSNDLWSVGKEGET